MLPSGLQLSGALDRALTVFVTWLLTYLVSRKIITDADALAFTPILLALPVALIGLYKNRQAAIVANAAVVAQDPASPLKGLITSSSAEGVALANSTPGPVVPAGTVQAQEIAKAGT